MFNFITQHRRGSTDEWNEVNIVPKNGEIVLEECSDGITRIKIGNGSSTFTDLQYVDQKLADEILSAHNRISELVKHEPLDTNTISTEVADIRHGYDNQDYVCAGDAVRAVGRDVYDLRNSLTQFINADAVDGLHYENSMLYLTANGEVIEETGVQIISGTGGGGGGSASVLKIGYITTSPYIITPNDTAVIKFTFSGVDSSGDDIMQASGTWKVDGKTVAYRTVLAGENSFDVTSYLNVGTSKVFLSVKDDAGNIVNKTWSVQKVDVKLTSTFNDTITYPIDAVSFVCTPYGAVDKTLHVILDGVELPSKEYSAKISGTPVSYSLPKQNHGSHLVEAYITAKLNDIDIESNHILKDILWYDPDSKIPVIGTTQQTIKAKQYDTTNITYTVFDPSTETPEVVIMVDDEEVSRGNITTSTNVYSYNTSEVGQHTIKIICGKTTKVITAEIEDIGVVIEPVTDSLAFDFNPVGRSNSDTNRLWTYNNVHMTVSDNFDWINGGYRKDENGVPYFCVKSGTTATIDYKLFGDDAKTFGKEVKVIFKTTNVSNAEASFLSCVDNTTATDHIGLDMKVHEARIYGQSGNLELAYSEEDKIEFEFNISSKDELVPMIMGYEDGVSTRPLVYTSAYNFKQNPNTAKDIVIGSNDCDVHIYRMKAYTRSLNSIEILNNFIADASTSLEMINRYKRNQIYNEDGILTPESLASSCPWLHVYKLSAPYFTNNKSDKVKNTTIQQIYQNGDSILDNWTCYNAQHSGQGTSSNNYGAAGRNLDFIMNKDGAYFELGDGSIASKITLTRTSVPTAYLNAKVNIASSNNLTNAILARRYNQYNPYHRPFVRDEGVDLSFIKDTMEFHNCVIFIQETDPDLTKHREFADNDWHFYAIGNIGDSKKTDSSRATDPDDPYECCVEIMDVSLPLSDFPVDTMMDAMEYTEDTTTGNKIYKWATDDNLGILYEKTSDGYELTKDTTVDLTKTYYVDILEHDDFSEDYTYGWRYLTDEDDEEATAYCKQKWIELYRFITRSTDEEFKAHFSDYFVKESALYYYMFTTRYCMVDNRAKNTFWHYGKTGEVDSDGNPVRKWDLCWDYDNDTSMGLNNFGKQLYSYGLEDIDKDENGIEVFRESDSLFFCRVRDLLAEDIQKLYNGEIGDGVNFDTEWAAEPFINECDAWQDEFPEELWRIDIDRKYIRTYTSSFITGEGNAQFLNDMCNGKMKYQRRQWERSQHNYIASKYQTSSAITGGAVFRCNIPDGDLVVQPDLRIKLTPFSRMYLNVQYSSTTIRIRATEPNKEYLIPFNGNDTDIINVYNSSDIRDFGDLSTCYLETADTSKAARIKRVLLGNKTEGYKNDGFQSLTTGSNILLEELNVENVTGLKGSLDLTKLTNLSTIYSKGSNINSLVFAEGGKISYIEAPALNSLIFKNLKYLENKNICLDHYDNVVDLCVDNCPNIDALELLDKCSKVNRVRLIDVDFGEQTFEEFSNKFFNLRGFDNNENDTDNAWLTGTVKFDTLDGTQYNELKTRYPNLTIMFNEIICVVTFFDTDLETVLRTQTVTGYDSILPTILDPVEMELIEKPVKEQTISHTFEWSGWSDKTDYVTLEESLLNNIANDLLLYPTFDSDIRKYTVKFFNNDNRLINSYLVDYGTAEFIYPVELPMKAGTATPEAYEFKAWAPEPKNITGDLSCYATYDLKPEAIYELTIDDFDYAIDETTLELTLINYLANKKIIRIKNQYEVNGETYNVAGILGRDKDPYDNIVTDGFNSKGIEYVELPDTLKFIGYDSFKNNPALASITIPESVTQIHSGAFADCTGLTDIYYNAINAVYVYETTSDRYPFYNAVSNHGYTVHIGNKVSKISTNIFNVGIHYADQELYGCRKLEFAENSVCSVIEDNAFFCSNMKEISLPESLIRIGNSALSSTRLSHVVLPNNLTQLGSAVFDGCATLEYVYIPASVTYIGTASFRGCYNINIELQRGSIFKWRNNCLINTKTKALEFGIRDVIIPDDEGLLSISDNALNNLYSTRLVIPQGMNIVGQSAIRFCDNLEEIVIPNTVTKLDNWAICDNKKLKEILLPGNLQYIGAFAIARTGISSIVIPSSVSTIGSEILKECYNLESVNMMSTTTNYIYNNNLLLYVDCPNLSHIKVNWNYEDPTFANITKDAPWGATYSNLIVSYNDKDVTYNNV